jgi:membrane protein
MLGAEVEAEIEHSRQLQARIKAEESLQLPPSDTSRTESEASKLQEQIGQARMDATNPAPSTGR